MSLSVACVLTGRDKYSMGDVKRLAHLVGKHLRLPHAFVVYTDEQNLAGARAAFSYVRHVPAHSPGWWGKMSIFAPRPNERLIYYDLDSLPVGDQAPLANLDVEFGICASFTKAAGHTGWPCTYGSCVMTLAPGFGAEIWEAYSRNPVQARLLYERGDQQAIEAFWPNATLLQDALPAGFFLGYRELDRHPSAPPPEAALVIYAGGRTPETTGPAWARGAWRG